MSAYIFYLDVDLTYLTPFEGHSWSNEWMEIRPNGGITVKGSNKTGYAWDGCSPKCFFLDLVWGTPDGATDPRTRKPKTYYASLIHDVLYQYGGEHGVSRRETDRLFYQLMRGFKWRWLYWQVVRRVSWMFWGRG